MAQKNVTQIASNIKPDDDVDALEAEAAEHERRAAEKRERARDLRADRRRIPMALGKIAETIGLESAGPLEVAAKAGRFEAWRLGGAERGTLISTIANVEAWLRTQPAAKVKPVKDAPVADVYELAVRAARGGR